MIVALLIFHGILAVFLLGAISHQCIAAWISPAATSQNRLFFNSLRRVRPYVYTNSVVVLYLLTLLFGAIIYPDFRVDVRMMFDKNFPAATGAFEIKEHFSAIGLGLLPAYWYYWQQAKEHDSADIKTPAIITSLLTAICWLGFLLGHILNNIKGLS